jgi:hypothetical protein
VSHWYPTQARIAELDAAAFEPPADARGDLPDYAEVLRAARMSDWFPPHQIHQWVWLASQYRLHRGTGGDAERIARRALEYLRLLTASSEPTPDDHRDLRWMLDASVRRLAALVGPAQIRSCLSADERATIELRLSGYDTAAFQSGHVRAGVAAQLERIGEMVGGAYLADIAGKIEALFGAAEKACPHARAALAYLAEHDDAVPDTSGFLGLVDDVYVIEWAFAASLHETRCLPILDGLLRRFPHTADIPLVGAPPRPLGTYSQYAVSAALHMLFHREGSHVLSVREAGPTPLLTAVFAAVECVRSHADDLDREIASWPSGTPITLSDGASTLRATFEGFINLEGKPRIRIGVRDRGTMLLAPDVVPYIARAAAVAENRLAKGGTVGKWVRTRHADPFVNVVGSARKALERQRCAMYVGPRWKLDAYMRCIRPMNGDVAVRLGVRHAISKTKFENHPGSVTDRPFLYTCSEATVAAALISDPPDEVDSWHVVIDGADLGRALSTAFSASGDAPATPRCTFVELHDREAAEDLLSTASTCLVLEDHDVQPSASSPWRAAPDDDELVRALARQPNYWTTTHEFVECANGAFEALAGAVRSLRASSDDRAERRNLELAVSALMRRALATPLSSAKHSEPVQRLVQQAASLAAPLRPYDEAARHIYAALRHPDVTSGAFCDRTANVRELATKVRTGERAAVLCRSEAIAEAYRDQFRADPVLNRVNWTTIQNIRRNAPLDRIIIPGWFDKGAIRETALAGFAETTSFVFYPFERDWYNAAMAAQRSWERRVDAVSAPHLRALAERTGATRDHPRLWRSQADLRTNIAPKEPAEAAIEDDADHDWIEQRAVAALDAAIPRAARPADAIRAHLVVFEGGVQYICLPPAAEVIVLSGRDNRPHDGSKACAEDYLYSTVSELKRGMVLAFSTGGDRDLLDARADEFMEHAEETRTLAGLWKTALKRHLKAPIDEAAEAFSRRMAEAGHSRQPFTVKAWATHTGTIAPRNFRVLVPLIAELTRDTELAAKTEETLAAIDLVYRARARAADAIVQELFSGDIDTEREELRFDVGGHEVRFNLRRVLTVRPAQAMPAEYVGKLSTFSAAAQL